MNYLVKDLTELTVWPGKPCELLIWNDPNDIPRKLVATGMRIGESPWIVPLNFGDGSENHYFKHAARIPANWTPYSESKEIPYIECMKGKEYRVNAACGNYTFDEICTCTNNFYDGKLAFSYKKDGQEHFIYPEMIQHVYTV